jgi:integrase
VLKELLERHRQFVAPRGLVFGATSTRPFRDTNIRKRSLTAWKDVAPVTLHECRHTYASTMIATGIPILHVSRYLGHADITISCLERAFGLMHAA